MKKRTNYIVWELSIERALTAVVEVSCGCYHRNPKMYFSFLVHCQNWEGLIG